VIGSATQDDPFHVVAAGHAIRSGAQVDPSHVVPEGQVGTSGLQLEPSHVVPLGQATGSGTQEDAVHDPFQEEPEGQEGGGSATQEGLPNASCCNPVPEVQTGSRATQWAKPDPAKDQCFPTGHGSGFGFAIHLSIPVKQFNSG
jgi:hypothetical protein